MRKSRSLAKTALAANALVWGGAALFLFAVAGENTYAAFHGQWYNILGWALICAVAIAITIVGSLRYGACTHDSPANEPAALLTRHANATSLFKD